MKRKKAFFISAILTAAFILWTLLVIKIDVKAIGPLESPVGFADLNGFVHELTGVNMTLYLLTDWLGLIPVGFIFAFGLTGLLQLIRRKSILKVDFDILMLGMFYIVVASVFVFFEVFEVNYRPLLINGILETSYPSSTTMLTACVMPTAAMQLNNRIKSSVLRKWVCLAIILFTLFMVIGRLVSGVHWFTDIIGGILISGGLVSAYYAAIGK